MSDILIDDAQNKVTVQGNLEVEGEALIEEKLDCYSDVVSSGYVAARVEVYACQRVAAQFHLVSEQGNLYLNSETSDVKIRYRDANGNLKYLSLRDVLTDLNYLP